MNPSVPAGMTVSGWFYEPSPEEKAARAMRQAEASAKAQAEYATRKHFTVADAIRELQKLPQDLPFVVAGEEVDDCECCSSHHVDEAKGFHLTQGQFMDGGVVCLGRFVEVRHG